MNYYVYENGRARGHKAIVHAGECQFCNHGMGVSGGKADPANAKWHGPFGSLDEARRFAKQVPGVEDARDDRCVMPDVIEL